MKLLEFHQYGSIIRLAACVFALTVTAAAADNVKSVSYFSSCREPIDLRYMATNSTDREFHQMNYDFDVQEYKRCLENEVREQELQINNHKKNIEYIRQQWENFSQRH